MTSQRYAAMFCLVVLFINYSKGTLTIPENTWQTLGDTAWINCTDTESSYSRLYWLSCGSDETCTSNILTLYRCICFESSDCTCTQYVPNDVNLIHPTLFSLGIQNSQWSNASIYQCRIYDSNFRFESRISSLSLADIPLMAALNPFVVNIIHRAPLTCNVSYKLGRSTLNTDINIRWLMNGQLIALNSNPSTSDGNDGSKVVKGSASYQFQVTDHGKQVSCQLRRGYIVWTTSAEVTLDVQFKPYGVTVSSSSADIKEGDDVTLTCNVEGARPTRITHWSWTKNTITVGTNHNLRVNPIRREQAGRYACNARNSVGLSVQPGLRDITVKYLDVSVSASPSTVTESETLAIRCITSGEPNDPISYDNWFFNPEKGVGREIMNTSGMIYTIENVRYTDAGNYTCSAGNVAFTGKTSTITIDVLYPPKEIPSTACKRVVGAATGGDAVLCLNVRANPYPRYFEWKQGTYPDLIYIDSSLVVFSEYNSSLKLTRITEHNFTKYTCEVTNGVNGTRRFVFELKPEGPPSPPENVEVTYVTAVSAGIAWTSPFNGGQAQRFTMEFRPSSVASWNNTYTDIADPGQGNQVLQHLSLLLEQNNYEIRVLGKNSFGSSGYSAVVTFTTKEKIHIGFIIGIVAALVLVIAVVAGIVTWRLRKRKYKQKRDTYQRNNSNQSEPLREYDICTSPYNKNDGDLLADGYDNVTFAADKVEYEICEPLASAAEDAIYEDVLVPATTNNHEIKREYVDIEKETEQVTAFGKLVQGSVFNNQTKQPVKVLIKVLKERLDGDRSDNSDRAALLHELNILKRLPSHQNIVSLTGCCTQQEPVLVLLEYMSRGDLRTFLKEPKTDHVYDNIPADSKPLTDEDLLRFGLQVASGMKFLSSQKIIHGDVATRNVWVDANHVCKITGFRPTLETEDLNLDNQPIRWMAPESIADNIFSTNSDVWSFGVLLWEVMTLSSIPYHGMSVKQVVEFVNNGGRLSKPDRCSDALYQVMTFCWAESAILRHSFEALEESLENLDHF